VKDNTINKVAVPPGPVGVTFLKDVDINNILLIIIFNQINYALYRVFS